MDDNVTMRLNRTVAQFRDRDRQSTSNSSSKSPDEEACAFFWKDLVCMSHSLSVPYNSILLAYSQRTGKGEQRSQNTV